MPFASPSPGVRVYYEESGPRTAPALLLLPTAGGDHTRWAANIPLLAEHFRVLGLDPRMTGRTEAPAEPFSIADLAADGVAVLDDAGVATAAVLGASMGGMVAQELALGWPERVWALVLACTTGGGYLATRSHEQRGAEMTRIMGLPPAERGRAFAETLYGPKAMEADPEIHRRLIAEAGWDQDPFPAFGPNAHFVQGAIASFDASERVGHIAAPTLVLHGDDDLSIDASDGSMLAKAIPGAGFTLLPGGHLFFAQHPHQFCDAVIEFLRRHLPHYPNGAAPA